MPKIGIGFDFAQFDTAKFDEAAETSEFTTKMAAEFNEPIFRFVYDGRIYDDFVIDAPTISRGADIVAGTTNIVLSNTPRARIDGVGIAFSENSPDPDTITDSNNGFVTAGFEADDEITVTGSTVNNDDYIVASVSAGALTLVVNDDLTAEGAGDLVTITSQPAFNMFAADRIHTMGKPCHLGMYFNDTLGYLYFMTGTVEDVSYNGATITLSIRDKMASMLEKRIGSGQAPADYYSGFNPFTPALLAWNILTEWGELDDRFSDANTDINFTSWSIWLSRCVAHNYQVRARFTGMTIQNALLRIGDLTNSFIWIDGEGFFQFKMFEPPVVAADSDETYDADNCVSIDLDIEKSTIKNAVKIYYGHDPDKNYNPQATITSDNIGFQNTEPDEIYIARVDHFLPAGFDTLDPITVSGSKHNDGRYFLQTVTDGRLTLTESNGLTDEDEGASVTLSQIQDTSTYRSTSIAFLDTTPNDLITDVTGGFVAAGITAGDTITITGSTSNDDTYVVDSVTADTITLDAAETLTTEPSGDIVILTQTHSISLTATTIAFHDHETGGPKDENPDPDLISKIDGGLLVAGFLPQYQVTVSGSDLNDSTYRLAAVSDEQLVLLHQTLHDEDSGATVTITQAHTLTSSGKQFEQFVTASNQNSIGLNGIRELIDEDKVVWHDHLLSAASAAEQKVLILKYPSELVRIDATMVGFLSDIADAIHVTEAQKSINDRSYFIKEIDIDIDNGTAEIMAEKSFLLAVT